MVNPLTVRQFAALTLGQMAPPWRLGDVRQFYGQKLLALGPTIAELSETETVIYGAVRPSWAVADTVSNREQHSGSLEDRWWWLWASNHRVRAASYKAAVSKNTLERFQTILESVGCSLVYVSPYTEYDDRYFVPAWAVVGFAGAFGDLASIPARTFSFDSRNWTKLDIQVLGELLYSDWIVIAPSPDIRPSQNVRDYASFSGTMVVIGMP